MGYFNENFVRGKIENWDGRPAGGQHHVLVVDEDEAARRDAKIDRGNAFIIDRTDADITGRTLAALGEVVAGILTRYVTTPFSLKKIADEVGVSYRRCRVLIAQGHVDFCEEWERQKYQLRAELRRMAPAIDPSRDAQPMIAQPRPDPWARPTANRPKAAPVLGYRKPATSAD